MSDFGEALDAAKIKIQKINLSKQRPVISTIGTMTFDKFAEALTAKLGKEALKYPEIFEAIHDGSLDEVIKQYAREKKILIDGMNKLEIDMPDYVKSLTLNMNMAAKGKEDRFFLTTDKEIVSPVAGEQYLLVHQLAPIEAAAVARKVIPTYLPRSKPGVFKQRQNDQVLDIFNTYIPPRWLDYPKLDKLPDKLPVLFEKLVNHLFPIQEERDYFYAWLKASLFSRAYVFLVLCGAPGTGKNRLKLILRALHGHINTVDGKKSTLTERFNSQLSESTLAWFDELHYDMEMENVMKELQNDSISIERKGIDATRSTRIYASLAVSNNKPRDNYVAFDARKFVPLVITSKRLEESMTPQEIDELTKKVEKEDQVDLAFVAQIAKWIKKHGDGRNWPNLEYRGPMFWTLAHTSMTRWQKRAVVMLNDPDMRKIKFGYDSETKEFLWNTLLERSQKKSQDRSMQFPDATSVSAFLEAFRDKHGKKAFKTRPVKGDIQGDFYVKLLFKTTEIVPEAMSITEQRKLQNAQNKKPKINL